MGKPINNDPAAGFQLDQKVVSAKILSLVGTPDDYASDFSNEFTAPINGQKTSTVLVRLAATVGLSDVPADRNGLLPRTGASATSVEVTLQDDKYFKVGVDTQGVAPSQTSSEIGTAGGLAIVRYGNANLTRELVAQGTPSALGKKLSVATSQDVWTAILNATTAFATNEYTESSVLYVSALAWNKLIASDTTLGKTQDPRATALTLLGIDKLRIVNLPGNAVAVVAHQGAAAQAKVLSGIRYAIEDFDEIVEARIKVGTKVLVPDAVTVVTATAE